jgi:hypothetical protein
MQYVCRNAKGSALFVVVGKEPLRKTHRLAVLRRSIHTGKTLMSEMLRSRAKDGITLS